MADGKNYLAKLIELLEADTTLQALHTNGVKVKISNFSPVGNVYPQICLYLDEGSSEMIFPCGKYVMCLTVWVEKDGQPYKTLTSIKNRVNILLNRKASSLSEINRTTNIGLRVVKNLKIGGETDFNEKNGLYYKDIRYETILNENESFLTSVAGDSAWV